MMKAELDHECDYRRPQHLEDFLFLFFSNFMDIDGFFFFIL